MLFKKKKIKDTVEEQVTFNENDILQNTLKDGIDDIEGYQIRELSENKENSQTYNKII